jgi:NAD(P)-dependent dehydrogenase (short-subunit alcohol dehydrogenase family)
MSKTATVLVTGASGVVGTAVLRRLRDLDVVCLMHRSPATAPHLQCVRGDIRVQRFGLGEHEYAGLVEQVDAIIHCAAVTDFNRTEGTLEATNVAGTQHVVDLAAASGATLYHVSTAFVHTRSDGERGRTAAGYAESKSQSEELVRGAGIPYVIFRPSVVIGAADTGEIAAFQGLHHVAAGIFAGVVPLIPFDPSRPIDFLPCDVVAVDLPRFVPPETFDRLIGPGFLEALPERIRQSLTHTLEFFTTYLRSGETKPSSLAELAPLGMRALPDQRTSLRTSLHTGHNAKAIRASRRRRWPDVASSLHRERDLARYGAHVNTGLASLARLVAAPVQVSAVGSAPFWRSTALAAAESDQVTLNEVFVPDALTFYPRESESMDPIQARGVVWFELLVSASYLLAATRALAFHPPSREAAAGPLVRYLSGQPLML